jgi:UTP--glucose-1-phosphate uridylyltransferase
MFKIRKAVFPVAGLGTRFLPATKASPKEMLPVVDKPLIQYAVEEAVAAGVETLIFITGRTKRSIEDHFDRAPELEAELMARGKEELLNALYETVPPEVECIYIRQGEALGLGHAVLCARSVVGNEPFAVLLADDLIASRGAGVMAEMAELAGRHSCSVLGIESVAPTETHRYGVIEPARVAERLWSVNSIVEKPPQGSAPSNLAVVGRYILTPRIFDFLAQKERGAGGEIQLTDAIAKLLQEDRVLGYEFNGQRYDCGSKLGYLEAQLAFGLQHPELGDAFRSKLLTLAAELADAEQAVG